MNNNFFVPMSSFCERRLDIESMITIATQFRDNIKIIDWEKWGNQKAFMPFERLNEEMAKLWIESNLTQIPKLPPGFKGYDVRWMPEGCIFRDNGEIVSHIIYSYNYATTWFPSLIATDSNHNLMIWDTEREAWAKLLIVQNDFNAEITDYVKGAFFGFLQAWIDW